MVPVYCLRYVANDRKCEMHGLGGGGQGCVDGVFFAQVCARNYSGVQFIVPKLCPILIPSPAHGPAGYQGDYLYGSCRIITLQPRLQSVH